MLEEGFATPGVVVMDVIVSEEENVYPMIPAGAAHYEIVYGAETWKAYRPSRGTSHERSARPFGPGREPLRRAGARGGSLSGRGFNIDSLAVNVTMDPGFSKIVLTTRGSEAIIEQIVKQLNKLITRQEGRGDVRRSRHRARALHRHGAGRKRERATRAGAGGGTHRCPRHRLCPTAFTVEASASSQEIDQFWNCYAPSGFATWCDRHPSRSPVRAWKWRASPSRPSEESHMKPSYDKDIDLTLIRSKRVAIIGYGSQGHAHALNLKESGVEVTVGLRRDSTSWNKALQAGLRVVEVEKAAAWGEVVMMLVPDELAPEVFQRQILPGLKPGKHFAVAHGFGVHFKKILPPLDVSVWLVAPKAPGHTVRREYARGRGVPMLLAIHKIDRRLALRGAAYAGHRRRARRHPGDDLSRRDGDRSLGEQAVLCGGLTSLIYAGYETLVDAGYAPEMAYFECVHELSSSSISSTRAVSTTCATRCPTPPNTRPHARTANHHRCFPRGDEGDARRNPLRCFRRRVDERARQRQTAVQSARATRVPSTRSKGGQAPARAHAVDARGTMVKDRDGKPKRGAAPTGAKTAQRNDHDDPSRTKEVGNDAARAAKNGRGYLVMTMRVMSRVAGFHRTPEWDELLSVAQGQTLAPYVWYGGEIREAEQLQVHFASHALHYGSAVFEGIRCYPTRAVRPFSDCTITSRASSPRRRSMGSPFDFRRGASGSGAGHCAQKRRRDAYLRPLAFSGRGSVGLAPKKECPVHVSSPCASSALTSAKKGSGAASA